MVIVRKPAARGDRGQSKDERWFIGRTQAEFSTSHLDGFSNTGDCMVFLSFITITDGWSEVSWILRMTQLDSEVPLCLHQTAIKECYLFLTQYLLDAYHGSGHVVIQPSNVFRELYSCLLSLRLVSL